MTKRKVFFRADASASIGYGHFVRTLALADMLKDQFDGVFFTQTPTDYQRAEIVKICKLIELPSDDTKFDIFLKYLTGDEIVVLDNYFFTSDYQREIKVRGCRLVCIDDIHDKHYVADVVINHAIDDKRLFSIEPYTTLCLGLEWALLRKPFRQSFDFNVKDRGHWLIAFGGSDYYNLTEKFVRLIHDNENVNHISVVVGDAYRYEPSLLGFSKLVVYKNLSAESMAAIMQKSEYAILPCSSICIEAIFQGCQVFAGYYVDNQVGPFKYLSSKKLIYPLGDLRYIDSYKFISNSITHYTRSKFCYNSLEKYKAIFNALGKSYIYDDLVFIDYILLPELEHKLIWKTRNDDAIRMHMDSTRVISWEEHCNFVARLNLNTQKHYWAVYNNGKLIGSVNISYVNDNTIERGIFVVPSQLGRNWGTRIEQALSDLLISMEVKTMIAKVLHTNKSSLCFHNKNGYTNIGYDDKYEYLLKSL